MATVATPGPGSGDEKPGSALPPGLLFHRVYERDPALPWVVLVHGAGGSSSIWFKQIRDYRDAFNVVVLDLRGHGRSRDLFEQWRSQRGYTLDEVSDDIIRVLDHRGIARAHFVGISLGTILIRVLADNYPERVASMVMGGAIIRLNLQSKVMLWMAGQVKRFVPYMWLYRFYAWVLMPKRRHAEARSLFVAEAKKLCQREFIRWLQAASNVIPLMRSFRARELAIPTLYLMGDEDYVFLPSVVFFTGRSRHARLHVVANSGHVCNVDQPEVFNRVSIGFIQETSASL